VLWALAFTLLQPTTATDERSLALRLTELRLAGEHASALHLLEERREADLADPALTFLHGDLLERLGRPEEAHDAFAGLLATELAPFARFRLARLQDALGHPEVAAGLLATLLGRSAPEQLIEPAAELFARALAGGGDCRLAEGVEDWRLTEAARRRLALSQAECRLAAGDVEGGRDLLHAALADPAGRHALAAAERLQALSGDGPHGGLARQVGLAFFHQRAFEEALAPLREAAAAAPTQWETHYAIARSLFWLRRYAEAVNRFEALLVIARTPEQRADALFQKGRCEELAGRWPEAVLAYQRSREAEPEGGWAAASLMAGLRLLWRQGDEAGALVLYDWLRERGSWRDTAAQAGLFLAASDLVRGRPDRAATWLDRAVAVSPAEEVEYWRGRLAELEGRDGDAVRHYGWVLVESAWGPFAAGARARLGSVRLATVVAAEAAAIAAGGTDRTLEAAWLLLGDERSDGLALRDRLRRSLVRNDEVRAALALSVRPPARWPPTAAGGGVAARLAELGFRSLDPEALQRRFPLDDPELAMTRAALLAAADDTTGSLRAAEVLARRLPDSLPRRLRPQELERLLFPRPYRALVERQARARGLETSLLFALMREESRFDPQAISPAAARGLTQFVVPTARRYAPVIGRAELSPEDLHDPEVAIALAAAYLGDLAQRFDGRRHQMLAAYNAGEEQATLWQSYCHSREPAEYLTKIGFRQTREYVRRVLASEARYRDLYAPRR
jgi:soluble lytic murein transglycosylase